MKLKELAILLNVPKERRSELKEVVDALVKDGKLAISRNGKIGRERLDALVGVYRANAGGRFGFVSVEGYDKDFYIHERNRNGALHEDVVLMQIIAAPGKNKLSEGRIVKIKEHGLKQVVGLYHKKKNFGFVLPDNQKITMDIYIPSGHDLGAVDGHKVVVSIDSYGKDGKKPEGTIIEILGHKNDPDTDILSVVRNYEIPEQFEEVTLRQASRIPEEVTEKEKAGRKDLRELYTITIDGEDAKDLDDAITLTYKDGTYELGVHIADVSHYVTEDSPLDKEALKRGTSVYLVDRVIPMLPHRLSNGICSLNQGCDRLALSCLMTFDENGNQLSHEIAETLICVNKRMSYTQVNEMIQEENFNEVPMIEPMVKLSQILRKKRKKRGALDFDFPESKIILDEKGIPLDVKPYERNKATDLIEDFMLAANETIAEDYFWQELPFLYRVHDVPDSEKIDQLAALIRGMGYSLKTTGYGRDIHPKELQKLLAKIADTDEEAFISRIALRSMKRACYDVQCTGHFGLAASYYCHFTSPIRRYPDLQIHRIIKENLHGGLSSARINHYEQILPDVATKTSQLERRADEAERETDKIKKVLYMKQHIGEVFSGIISSVTEWGLYVELDNTIEGLVHVNSLDDDFYLFDKENYLMRGEKTLKEYKLGQRVNVCVMQANKLERTIDFVLVEDDEEE
ncbi:3'-to-5' exoribonuclease RNase R [Lachnospiraceae bacterium TWA4]|nr:3'-to-5' exoribonuclease RNase R [Lachnospiraceae bacterium TWA4]